MKKVNLSTTQLWPAFIPIKKDELFSSWLVRIAHNHAVNYTQFYVIALQSILLSKKDNDLIIDEYILNQLSVHTGLKISRIKESLLIAKCEYSFVIPISKNATLLKRSGVMFCPGCLTADGLSPYFRKQWRLATSFFCSTHKCFLYDRCPNCKAPVMLTKAKILDSDLNLSLCIIKCYHCNFLLSNSKLIKCHFSTLMIKFQHNLNSLLLDKAKRDQLTHALNILRSKRKKYLIFRKAIYKDLKLFDSQNYRVFVKLNVIERSAILRAAIEACARYPKIVKTLANGL